MNVIKKEEIFKLKDLISIEKGKILTEELVHNDAIKMVLKSFDEGMALPEHTAPGTALIFALEGKAVITNNGVEYTISGGENYAFFPEDVHSVRAVTAFKMAVVLVKEK